MLAFERLSVSVALAGTVVGSSASLNVTANVSTEAWTVPFLFVTAKFAALVVGAAVS